MRDTAKFQAIKKKLQMLPAARADAAEVELAGKCLTVSPRKPAPTFFSTKTIRSSWYPWGNEAFARARQEDKPIFLSVGYSTCHWCHVMEHESFENGDLAELLNRSFVSIKVDREERPDVDRVYMTFVQATTDPAGGR